MAPEPTSPGEYIRDEKAKATLEAGLEHRLHENQTFDEVTSGILGDDKAPYAVDAKRRGWFVQMLQVFSRNRLAVVFLILLLIVVGFSFLGPVLYHTNQTDASQFLGLQCNQPPGPKHPLGTDGSCFDMLGRLMVGGQASLEVGFTAAIASMVIGIFYGIFAGYRGGWVDTAMMRLLDILLSIPGLFLVLISVELFGHHKNSLILVIAITGWYGVARILRAEALSLREREYVQAVRSMGGGSGRIIWRHIIPNSISTTVTLGTYAIGDSILTLAALGFLALGLQAPQTDWGTILNTSTTAILLNYWWEIWPVVALFLIVIMSFNYIGDALRDAFEVRLRER